MASYLIEHRFQGKFKTEIKQLIIDLDNKFNLGLFQPNTPIPHISLVGPFTTNNEARLIQNFTEVCKSTPFCRFKINGFGYFKDNRVVYVDINPAGEKLKEFRWNLVQKLKPNCELKKIDLDWDFVYHGTLAKKLNHQEFKDVKNYIERQTPPKIQQFLIRATIIKNNKILCEYDFLQRRLLNRTEALDKNVEAVTWKLLKDFFEGRYAPNNNISSRTPENIHRTPKKTPRPLKTDNSGMINKMKQFLSKIFD